MTTPNSPEAPRAKAAQDLNQAKRKPNWWWYAGIPGALMFVVGMVAAPSQTIGISFMVTIMFSVLFSSFREDLKKDAEEEERKYASRTPRQDLAPLYDFPEDATALILPAAFYLENFEPNKRNDDRVDDQILAKALPGKAFAVFRSDSRKGDIWVRGYDIGNVPDGMDRLWQVALRNMFGSDAQMTSSSPTSPRPGQASPQALVISELNHVSVWRASRNHSQDALMLWHGADTAHWTNLADLCVGELLAGYSSTGALFLCDGGQPGAQAYLKQMLVETKADAEPPLTSVLLKWAHGEWRPLGQP